MLSLSVYITSQMKAKKCNFSCDTSSKACYFSFCKVSKCYCVICYRVINIVKCPVLYGCSSFTHRYIKMDDTSSLPPSVQKCGKNIADTSAGAIRRSRLRGGEVPSQACRVIWHTSGLSCATMLWDMPCHLLSPSVTSRRSIALSRDTLEFNASCGELLMKCLWAAHYFPLGRGVGADVFVWNKKQIPTVMERQLIPVAVN